MNKCLQPVASSWTFLLTVVFILTILFLNSAKFINKMVTGCVARNVVSGTIKYELVRKTRGSLFVVDATNQNVRSFLIFL